MSRMLIATSLNIFWDQEMSISTDRMLERCAQAGFGGVDYNFCDFDKSMIEQMSGASGPASYFRSVRAKAEALGLRFVQAHGPMFNQFAEPASIADRVALSHDTIRWAAELEVPWIVFHSGTFPGAFDAEHLMALRQRNVDFFASLLRTAEKVGVGIAIENLFDQSAGPACRRRYCATPEELVALIDVIDHPLVGACWDVGHAHLQRLDQTRALRAVGPRLKAVHIQDNDGVTDQHMLPFWGGIDWKELVSALREIGYEGTFCYETHRTFRDLPDALRDDMLRYAVHLGEYLLRQ